MRDTGKQTARDPPPPPGPFGFSAEGIGESVETDGPPCGRPCVWGRFRTKCWTSGDVIQPEQHGHHSQIHHFSALLCVPHVFLFTCGGVESCSAQGSNKQWRCMGNSAWLSCAVHLQRAAAFANLGMYNLVIVLLESLSRFWHTFLCDVDIVPRRCLLRRVPHLIDPKSMTETRHRARCPPVAHRQGPLMHNSPPVSEDP